ncbi:MAG: DUF3348 domain-containing protein [Rhizobacter sp.]|nr:DUF3348 domain-containing protein [Rhizobacter sp.]
MSPALPRTSFNSSSLVRALSNLTRSGMAAADVVDATDSKQTLAERLSPWLAWTDAIALSAVLEGGSALMLSDTPSDGTASVIDEWARVRAELTRAITADPVFATDHAGSAASFAPYRHRYVTHQRAMEARIGRLRAKVRAALAGHSPKLRRLAALDAVLEHALSARERQLLSTVPKWLEKHFERLRHGQQELDGKDMQGVLLAELETRLQPVEGMIDALGNEAQS